jgi:hypothetical protein
MVDTAKILGGVDVGTQEHTLAKRLAERRITPQTIQIFDIQPKGTGWTYPTPDGGRRWKNANSQTGYKYRWEDGPKKATGYYYAFDLPQAIEQTGGACWMVSGEADVWAMRSGGVYHVFSSYTESTIPPDLGDFCQRLGITNLLAAPDLDEQGTRWAGKLAAAMAKAGIDFTCHRLPQELGDKGDVGKAWQGYTKRLAFERYLLDLPQVYIPLAEEKKTAPLLPGDLPTQWGDVPAELRALVANALGVTGFKSSGYSKLIFCPFHKEDTPSAQLHETKGLKCWHVDKHYRWVDVAAKLGIDAHAITWAAPIDTWHTTPAVGLTAAPTPATLHLEAKQALIALGFTSLARVLDRLYQNGYQGSEVLTLHELQAICPDLPAYTIRAALEQGTGKTPPRKQTKNYCGNFSPLISLAYEGKENLNNSKRGRKFKAYRLPTAEEVAKTLGVKAKYRLDLEPGKLAKAADYRAEVMAAPVYRRPGQYFLVQLTKPLGVSKPTGRAYTKRANLETILNIDKGPAPLRPEELAALPRDLDELKDLKKQRLLKAGVWLETKTGRKYEYTQQGAARAREYHGPNCELYKVQQFANTYQPKLKGMPSNV